LKTDAKLQGNPTSFEEVVRMFKTLPDSKGIPKVVYLYPLCKLDAAASKLVCQISSDLVSKASSLLSYLENLILKTKELSENAFFGAWGLEHLRSVKERLEILKTTLSGLLCGIVPKIRGGGKEEEELSELIQKWQGFFSAAGFEKWLDEQKRIASIVGTLISQFGPNLNMVGDLAKELVKKDVKDLMILSFNRYDSSFGPLIDSIEQFLRTKNVVNVTHHSWLSGDRVKEVREVIESFEGLYELNFTRGVKFCMMFTDDEKNDSPCKISKYCHGKEVENFSHPRVQRRSETEVGSYQLFLENKFTAIRFHGGTLIDAVEFLAEGKDSLDFVKIGGPGGSPTKWINLPVEANINLGDRLVFNANLRSVSVGGNGYGSQKVVEFESGGLYAFEIVEHDGMKVLKSIDRSDAVGFHLVDTSGKVKVRFFGGIFVDAVEFEGKEGTMKVGGPGGGIAGYVNLPVTVKVKRGDVFDCVWYGDHKVGGDGGGDEETIELRRDRKYTIEVGTHGPYRVLKSIKQEN
jgi:hypothetical protein